MAWQSGYGGSILVTTGPTAWSAGVTDWLLNKVVGWVPVPYLVPDATGNSFATPPLARTFDNWTANIRFIFDSTLGNDDLLLGALGSDMTIRLKMNAAQYFVGTCSVVSYGMSCPIDGPNTGVCRVRGNTDDWGWTAAT